MHRTQTSALHEATERLYATFARYPLRPRIDGCPHCDLGAAERGLHTAPLRALSAAALSKFAFKTMTTFGDVDDFRHFLPRIAELLVEQGALGAADLGIFVTKLEYGHWNDWPTPERAAIHAWLDGLEDAYVSGALEHTFASDLIDATTRLRGSPDAFFVRWPSSRSVRVLDELAHEVLHVSSQANRGTAPPPALVAARPAIRDALYVALGDPTGSTAIALAIDALDFTPFVT